MGHSLEGLTVLVTRPEGQAGSLCELIAAENGRFERFPTLEIIPVSDVLPLKSAISRLNLYQMVIFITANAARLAAPFWLNALQPGGITQIAMGPATAKMMEQHAIRVDGLPSQNYSSEGLLKMSEFQDLAGKRVLMIMGEGGRKHLIEEMTRQGAEVEEVILYKRRCPDIKSSDVAAFWMLDAPKIIVSTSVASLENLISLAGEQVFSIPLLVVSERMSRAATDLGPFQDITVAPKVTDQAVLETLVAWYASGRSLA